MATNGEKLKFTLYTNHRCPFAHRVHIVVKELGLEYEEVIIDLDTPREPWYLEINPRGLVPSIKFGDQILTESAIVAQFFADAYPSHLLPPSNGVDAALKRARIDFFVDTWSNKAGSFMYKIAAARGEEQSQLVDDLVAVLKKEIEPLLEGGNPFFGGSEKFTLAEAMIAPFLVRMDTLAKHDLLPKSLISGFETLPNFSKWFAAVIKQESVLYVYSEETIVAGMKKRFAKAAAERK